MSTLSDISNTPGIILGSDYQSQLPGIRLDSLEPLAERRVHEAEGHSARAMALLLVGKSEALSFWIATDRKARTLRARALNAFLNPTHLVCVEVANRQESLWAAEEALRCRGAGLVILQVDTGPNLFESRRLQIAAQAGGTTGFVIVERRAQSSAAQTRWHCDALLDPGSDAPPDWRWSLTKNKQGRMGRWSVRGDPDPMNCTPPDLLPKSLEPRPDNDHFYLTTLPCALVSPASARPMAPA